MKRTLVVSEVQNEIYRRLGRAFASPDRAAVAPRVIAAVSGGEDSQVLFHALCALRERLRFEIGVCHVDHGIRPESGADAQAVRALAERVGAPFFLKRLPRKPAGENLEAWARRERYLFFRETARLWPGAFICTAHHAKDQAETLLFRALTGRLATDSSCIEEMVPEFSILRPMLYLSKGKIAEYAKAAGLEILQDSTNEATDRSRNKIRHELLPTLLAVNPRLVEGLSLTAKRFQDDELVLNRRAEELAQSSPLTRQAVTRLEPAYAWRVLRIVAERTSGLSGALLGYENLDHAVELLRLKPQSSFSVDLGFMVTMRCARDGDITFVPSGANEAETPPRWAQSLELPGQVQLVLPGGNVVALTGQVLPVPEAAASIKNFPRVSKGDPLFVADAFFDADALPPVLTVRTKKDGDSMAVWGRGRRKLKKLFQEAGVARPVRGELPIICAGSEIFWVPGVARSKLAPITETSVRVALLHYQRSAGGSAQKTLF